ncbi:type II CAAX endopeptidase family protein [Phenylobacterium sp.]|uniref:CPBP family intramembrane glutamic endopeptidase n=1 Tax=Phenylobacterium sp. TaxID=1871053 RepID=UPI002DEEA303|nr:type II CAAX endopeptidase family protein [Phenylobacterium sp.]
MSGREASAAGRDGDGLAASLRGFGPLGLLGIVVVMLPGGLVAPGFYTIPISGLLVLAWAAASRTPLSELGFARPKSWAGVLALGVLAGVTLKLVMKAAVMPLLGADPVNQAYHVLAHNPAALPGAIFSMIVGAGFGEETTFRGFGFERLGKLLGLRPAARAVAVLVTSAAFAAGHYANQGLAGVEQAAITGLVFGTLFALTGRLWLSMIAHAAFDLTALAMIYFDVERLVAKSLLG